MVGDPAGRWVGAMVVEPAVVGPEVVGPEMVGPEVVGPEVVGPEVVGPEVVGGRVGVAKEFSRVTLVDFVAAAQEDSAGPAVEV